MKKTVFIIKKMGFEGINIKNEKSNFCIFFQCINPI